MNPPISITTEEETIIGILRENGHRSRTDIARITGFSRAKITPIVSRLIGAGILKEDGVEFIKEGRPPRFLDFNQNYGFVAGVDIGVSTIEIGLSDMRANLLERSTEQIDKKAGPEIILEKVRFKLREMINKQRISPEKIYGIGVGVPGPIDLKTNLQVAPLIVPSWLNFPIKDFFYKIFPFAKVVVENDVKVMTVGELRAGAGKGIDNFIFVKIGIGIGAGIVVNGEIYQGSTGSSGDIGHICVDPNGPLCYCGNKGCLESLSGGYAIAKRAIENAQSGKSTILAELMQANGGTLTAMDLGAAARVGDPVSMEIIQDIGKVIGNTLASMVNFFNPSMILIGGGVSNIGNQFLSSIRQAILHHSHPLSTRDLRIDYSLLGSEAGVMGAVYLALEQIFEASYR